MSQPVFVVTLALASSAFMTVLIATFVSVGLRAGRFFALAGMAVTITAVSFAILGSDLRLNFTPSTPLGIYRLEPLPTTGVRRGMLVAVCAPAGAAEPGRRRGYLSAGPCPHDTELLLKTVVGIGGDDVAVFAKNVAVNGDALPHSAALSFDRAGRQLSHWPRGDYHLGSGQVWLYADNDRSWDSRYWGPASFVNIVARAVPLLVVAAFRSTSGEPLRCRALPKYGRGAHGRI